MISVTYKGTVLYRSNNARQAWTVAKAITKLKKKSK